MTNTEKRIAAVERAIEAQEIARILGLNVGEAIDEFARLERSNDTAAIQRFIRCASTQALSAIVRPSCWIERLPTSDLLTLRDGRAIMGPLPPGLGYR